MTNALVGLLGFVGWTLLLVLAVISIRAGQVLRGVKQSNEFTGGVQHGGAAYWRLNRAHANAVENLIIFAALVLIGTWLRVDTVWFQRLPLVVLGARVVQSVAHIASNAVMVVNLRFTAFVIQWISFAWMLVEILRFAGPR